MKKILELMRLHRQATFAILDVLLLSASFVLVGLCHGTRGADGWRRVLAAWALCTGLISAFLQLFHTNRSLWRYAGAREYMSLIYAYGCGFALFFLLNKLVLRLNVSELLVLLAVLLALLLSFYVRACYHTVRQELERKPFAAGEKRYLAIIGAGRAGVALQQEIARNPHSPYVVWGFFDDDPAKIGMTIGGVAVLDTIDQLPKLIKTSPVHDLVLAIPTLTVTRRQEIIQLCSQLQCGLRIMPDAISMMERATDRMEKSMRPVQVEDLLGRTTIRFEAHELAPLIHGRTILVTGGGGSIGSELCRQLVHAGAGRVVIFDLNENDSYMLLRELTPVLPKDCELCIEIGSMANRVRVEHIFRYYRPAVVFHAAAHKHVPLMEDCPCEAVYNNIFGTWNLLQAARECRCEKFVLISSDKAVNPTSIMGATKRYCENLLRAASIEPDNPTVFVAVRFGNVLGSHGSVIPLFQMQIAQGGPVTITDKRMTRYFMTIPEAAGLVLRAGAMAKSSETYILDMGKPVSILKLAEKLICLSGYVPYRQIDIVETGLRPGEKLYEQLLVHDKAHIATTDSKILIERNETALTLAEAREQLQSLRLAVEQHDNDQVLQLMYRFVPGFTPAPQSPREP